ncbi:uncharacterized protein LOC141628480 [Silene latifolia]|uniref:uncharacterized protein LOC141628480 n=1 Tax=Silene latifolia TaxID=37657 RepID=UPI003D7863FF
MVKEAVDVVPIWIRFYGLPLKFWGNALMKIAAGGEADGCDNTLLKTFLGYARIMVEVKIGTDLPDVIQFADELDNNHRQIVHYEWKPILCTDCQGLGHLARDCRKAKTTKVSRPAQQVWRPKKVPQNVSVPSVEHGVAHEPPEQQEQPIVQARGPLGLESLGGLATPMPGLVTPMPNILRSFTPARIITKMTRQGGMCLGSGTSTYMEVLEHSVHYRRVLAGEMEALKLGVIHAKVSCTNGRTWWMSIIYGFNKVQERIPLWDSLRNMRQVVNGPWLVMGDFNNVLAMCERVGSEVSNYELRGFQDCVEDCGIVDLPAHGAFFTWNNKHEPGAMVFSRIDRAMSNDEWLDRFPEVIPMFHP